MDKSVNPLYMTLFQVAINGEVIGDVGWYQQLGVTFIGLGLKTSDVSTLTLRHTDIEKWDWISIFEVRGSNDY